MRSPNLYVLCEIDDKARPRESPDDMIDVYRPKTKPRKKKKDEKIQPPTAHTVIDVMILYSTALKQEQGNMRQFIGAVISAVNQYLSDSEVGCDNYDSI